MDSDAVSGKFAVMFIDEFQLGVDDRQCAEAASGEALMHYLDIIHWIILV